MRVEFRLPSLGADMDSATLTQWLKKPGEHIRRGEPLATVETTKGLIDIESYSDAEVLDLLAEPGTVLSVGAVLAHLQVEPNSPGAPAPDVHAGGAAALGPPAGAPAVVPASAAGTQPPGTRASGARLRISPAARRRAHELGIALEQLEHATVPDGVVHIEDVERLAAPTALPSEPRAAMRDAIGTAMTRAKREIPHYYLGHTVDFGAVRAWLAHHNEPLAVQDRLLESVLITKAVALAAARIEGFNGYFRAGRFERASGVHVGTAIAVRGGGLVAPALLDADRKDLTTLMHEFSALVTRVRAGHMRSGEFATASITVTSLGAEGVDLLYPIINPPQVAIVGSGAIREAPWVHAGAITIRPLLTLTLAADHRVSDGRAGARFLRQIADLLAEPEALGARGGPR